MSCFIFFLLAFSAAFHLSFSFQYANNFSCYFEMELFHNLIPFLSCESVLN